MELLINVPEERLEELESNLAEDAGSVEELLGTMRAAARIALEDEGVDPEWIEISLSFVSPEEIHALNRDFRGVDRVTDVLSFPLVEDLNELPGLERSGPANLCAEEEWSIPLGDVVICVEQARAQAAEYGHSQRREMVYLFVHSVLHLLGYDHMEEEERREMRAHEESIMQRLALPR